MPNPLSAYGVSDRDYAAAIGTAMGEANREGVAGMAAVMDVMANRLSNPAGYGAREATLAGIAYGTRRGGMQFDAWNKAVAPIPYRTATVAAQAAIDPAFAATLPASFQQQLAQAQEAAFGVLSPEGALRGITLGATFYGNTGLMSAARIAEHMGFGNALTIGNHTFRGANLSLGFDRDAALAANANAYQSFQTLGMREAATGLTYDPTPVGPYDSWAEQGRAEVAGLPSRELRGLSDFGPPVQTEEWGQTAAPSAPVERGAMLDDITPSTRDDVRGMPSYAQVPDVSVPDVPSIAPSDFGAVAAGVNREDYGPQQSFTTGGGFGVDPPSYDPLSSVAVSAESPAPSGGFSWAGPLADRAAPMGAPVADFSRMEGAGWTGGATGSWDAPRTGSFGTTGTWEPEQTTPAWSGGLADRQAMATSVPSNREDVGGPGIPGGYAPGYTQNTGWGAKDVYDAPASLPVSDYGFSGMAPTYTGGGYGMGYASPGNPITPTASAYEGAAPGFGYAMSPASWGGLDVSQGYSGGAFDGTMGYGITPQSYGGIPNVSVPDVPAAASTFKSTPTTAYKTVTEKTINPAWTSYQAALAAQQAAPTVPTLGMDFGALPSMVGNLGYASALPGANVTPLGPAPPQYIETQRQVPITIQAPAAPGKKPAAPVEKKKAVAVNDWQTIDAALASAYASPGFNPTTFGGIPAPQGEGFGWAGQGVYDAATNALLGRMDPSDIVGNAAMWGSVPTQTNPAWGGGSMDAAMQSVLASNPRLAAAYAAGNSTAGKVASNLSKGYAPSAGITDPGEFSRAESMGWGASGWGTGYNGTWGGGDYNGGFNSDGSYSGNHGGSLGVGGLW